MDAGGHLALHGRAYGQVVAVERHDGVNVLGGLVSGGADHADARPYRRAAEHRLDQDGLAGSEPTSGGFQTQLHHRAPGAGEDEQRRVLGDMVARRHGNSGHNPRLGRHDDLAGLAGSLLLLCAERGLGVRQGLLGGGELIRRRQSFVIEALDSRQVCLGERGGVGSLPIGQLGAGGTDDLDQGLAAGDRLSGTHQHT